MAKQDTKTAEKTVAEVIKDDVVEVVDEIEQSVREMLIKVRKYGEPDLLINAECLEEHVKLGWQPVAE